MLVEGGRVRHVSAVYADREGRVLFLLVGKAVVAEIDAELRDAAFVRPLDEFRGEAVIGAVGVV